MTSWKEKKIMCKKYEVLLTRTVVQTYRIQVEANNEQHAQLKALNEAGNLDFHEGNSRDPDYGVEEVTELEDDNKIVRERRRS
jgi:hypothetical protein